MSLKNLLKLRQVEQVTDLDDPSTTELHGRIIQAKPFLRAIYLDLYRWFAASLPASGRVVELGSGGGFLRQVLPRAVTSDVLPVSGLSLVCSALEMPFADASLDAVVMINVLHHLPDAARFLREMQRVLKPGGKVLMSEPANTCFGRFIYTHFHHEPFNPAGGWTLPAGGPLSGANGALPWIVLRRDRARREREFPHLRLVRCRAGEPWRYLVSGGVSRRSLAPGWAWPVVTGLEWLATPAHRWIGMFYRVEMVRV